MNPALQKQLQKIDSLLEAALTPDELRVIDDHIALIMRKLSAPKGR
jgi:hypothetical protein